MLKPVGWHILIKLDTFEEEANVPESLKNSGFKIKAGLDAYDDRRTKVAMETGTVVGMGSLCFKGSKFDNQEPWCKVGDRVIFGKHAGKLVIDRKTKEEFFLINDDDIQVVEE
jgi:co-chaperonin GroES (HSP10)